MRLADIMISFPGIILAIAMAGIMGGSMLNAILAFFPPRGPNMHG